MNDGMYARFHEKAGVLRTQTEAKGQSEGLAGAGRGSCLPSVAAPSLEEPQLLPR